MKTHKFLKFISVVGNLDHQQRTILTQALNQLADEPRVYEQIETVFDKKQECPDCSHNDSYRHGIVNDLQRYRCKSCKKTYHALSGTPLAHLRYKSKWLKYLDALTETLTVRQAAKEVNVHRNNTFRILIT